MFRRERDTRRVVKAVRSHEDTMAALGRASFKNVGELSSSFVGVTGDSPENAKLSRMTESYPGESLWNKPKSVRDVNSTEAKIDRQNKKGLITQGEAQYEKTELSMREGNTHRLTPSKKQLKALNKKSQGDK